MRIKKCHTGRSVDISASNGFDPINGVIEAVKNGFATIRYYSILLNGSIYRTSQEGYTARIPIDSGRIITIY
ncbi:MAG: hypothetical protein WC491_07240 [Candidatus Omnitrophota bacterium]|jgi:hypothetical protein